MGDIEWDSRDAVSTNSFVNQLWNPNSSHEEYELNIFSSVSLELTLYENEDFATYQTFLDSVEATQKIDEDRDYLTQSTLNNFKQYVNVVDAYAIQVKMVYSEPLSQENQVVGFCIGEYERGLQCASASSGTDENLELSEFRTYWFSDFTYAYDKINDPDTPMELWTSEFDDYIINDIYFGLTQYVIRAASSTSFVADKF